MVKRKSSPNLPGAKAKRPRCSLTGTESIFEQAEKYRLATAKFPVDVLTAKWKKGQNRCLDEKHVQALCRMFTEQNLQREPAENHLRVACTRAEVERMKAHLGEAASPSAGWMDFEDWMVVNENQVEIMAGQHRVAALKELLKEMSDAQQHLWWICDVYDIDQLPLSLRVQLCANRLSSTLPDNNGQIWMELVALSADGSLFRGNSGSVQDEMQQALGLSGRVPFPIRRLVTLWKNEPWREMITKWCQTPIGEATFSISLWDEMARRRIDDFWFDMFNQVLDAMSQLKLTKTIHLTDWNQLAELPSPRSSADLWELFYPDSSELEAKRRPKFLSQLKDEDYRSIHDAVLQHPGLCFPDLQKVVRVARAQGTTISKVMGHVAEWINPCPSGGERIQLWEEFVPVFEEDRSRRSRDLARNIFNIIKDRTNELTDAHLASLPRVSGDSYLERFKVPIWNDLLIKVHKLVGASFHGVLEQFNTRDPRTVPVESESTLVQAVNQAVRDAVSQYPDVARYPVLRHTNTLKRLINDISPAITDWAESVMAQAAMAEDVQMIKDPSSGSGRATHRPVHEPLISSSSQKQAHEGAGSGSAPIHREFPVAISEPEQRDGKNGAEKTSNGRNEWMNNVINWSNPSTKGKSTQRHSTPSSKLRGSIGVPKAGELPRRRTASTQPTLTPKLPGWLSKPVASSQVRR